MSVNWQDAGVLETYRRMTAEGQNAGAIARRIPGATRNSVIGKWHRDGVERGRGRQKKEKSAPERREALDRRSAAAREERRRRRETETHRVEEERMLRVALLPPAPVGGVRPIDLESHHCRWPMGDDLPTSPEFRHCGAGRETDGRPYCPKHERLAAP